MYIVCEPSMYKFYTLIKCWQKKNTQKNSLYGFNIKAHQWTNIYYLFLQWPLRLFGYENIPNLSNARYLARWSRGMILA